MKKYLLLFSVLGLLLVSCNGTEISSSSLSSSAEEETGFVHAEGKDLIGKDGKKYFFKGTNVGSLYLQESWMSLTDSPDLLNTVNVLTSLYGKETCFDLLDIYQENYWTEEDFKNCKDIGFNTLRLPITFIDVFDTDYSVIYSEDTTAEQISSLTLTLREDHLKKIDTFIDTAEKYGLGVVLDLHGAFGSQNGNDHSGDSRGHAYLWDQNELGEAYREKTLEVWKALATRYKDENNIVGYDLLNEPAGPAEGIEDSNATGEIQWDYYDELYKAIRAIDSNHLLIMESCWNGENLPDPSTYSWENVMYEFHHYEWSQTDDDSYQYTSYVNKVTNILSQNFSLPLYMGEFRPFGSVSNYISVIKLLQDNNFSWTTWTYRVTNDNNWGLYYYDEGASKAHIQTAEDCDYYTDIEKKWSTQRDYLQPNQELIDAFKELL